MKEQLLLLIEAYASARPTGNALLQSYATEQLSKFLSTIELIPSAAISAALKPEEAGD